MNPKNCHDDRWGSVVLVSKYCPTLVVFSFFFPILHCDHTGHPTLRRFSKIWVHTTHGIQKFNNPNLYFGYLLESIVEIWQVFSLKNLKSAELGPIFSTKSFCKC